MPTNITTPVNNSPTTPFASPHIQHLREQQSNEFSAASNSSQFSNRTSFNRPTFPQSAFTSINPHFSFIESPPHHHSLAQTALTSPYTDPNRLSNATNASLYSEYNEKSLLRNKSKSTSSTFRNNEPSKPDSMPQCPPSVLKSSHYQTFDGLGFESDAEFEPSIATGEDTQNAGQGDNSKFKFKSRLSTFVHSFHIVSAENEHEYPEDFTDFQKRSMAAAKTPLVRGLKPRHMQMIAFGGAIGTGLFIRSGSTLTEGGPAALVIGFSLTGIMLTFTIQALGELAVKYPVTGSFSTYSTRFLDPAWGFAMGWNYLMQWLIVLPLELIAAAMTIQYWGESPDSSPAATVNPVAWATLFYVFIVFLNLFGVHVYGEIESVFSVLKVSAVVGFSIMGIVLTAGGGPDGQYIGAKYWHNPGAFSHGVKGVINAFVSASFSYSGIELTGLAAAEARNPRRAVPSAVKQVCWRIIIFYITSLTIVGFLVPYNDSRLLGAKSNVDISVSPFVIAIQNAGISALPSVFNAVILLAVISVANSAVYASSRTMVGLAIMGQAPKQLGYIDKAGRPIFALCVSFFFGLLVFVSASKNQTIAFNWLLALSGLSSLITWGSICLAHIRFRQGLKSQGRTTAELAFTAPLGIWGSAIGFAMITLILTLLVWISLFPVGSSSASAENFFENYIGGLIVLAFFLAYKFYFKTKFISTTEMDLDSGTRDLDIELLQLEIDEEKHLIKEKGRWYYFWNIWC